MFIIFYCLGDRKPREDEHEYDARTLEQPSLVQVFVSGGMHAHFTAGKKHVIRLLFLSFFLAHVRALFPIVEPH